MDQSNKKSLIISLAIFLVLFAALPIIVWQVQKPQEIRSRAQTSQDSVPSAIDEGKRLTLKSAKDHAVYQRADVQEKPQALAALKDTIRQRKAYMSALAESNPQEFLMLVLPQEIRSTIPAELSGDIESEVTLEGTLKILHEDYFEEEKSKLFHYLESGDGRFLLTSPKQFPSRLGGIKVKVSGVKLGETLVLPTTEKNNFELLEAVPPELPIKSSININ